MVAPVEIRLGGVELLVDNGLPKQYQGNDRYAVWSAYLTALSVAYTTPTLPKTEPVEY